MSSALNIDLWPKEKFETDTVTPVSILRRQAALLGDKTQQLVTAEVASDATPSGHVTHRFRLVVPSLDNYKYELFSVHHQVDELYPAYAHDGRLLRDQDEFVNWLKRVLSSESTIKKIDSLMAQAKA